MFAVQSRWKTSSRTSINRVGGTAVGDEVGRHQLLPSGVDLLAGHPGEGLLERAGHLDVAEQRAVVAKEQRVVVPAVAREGCQHVWPHGGVVGLVLLQPVGPDVEHKAHPRHRQPPAVVPVPLRQLWWPAPLPRRRAVVAGASALSPMFSAL